ncbi:MAG: electron transport complex subunit RsxC [Candidatus Omnitrophica bacterium]|nr:electron transport complex subunit RsxC [Candidatus Omnitrophota bacterium]
MKAIKATFRGGIHPPAFKYLTQNKPIKNASLPSRVVIPLSQHIGAPAQPIVQIGNKVRAGTKIGAAAGKVSANVHSSISGQVKDIKNFFHPAEGKSLSIIIESDGKDEKEFLKIGENADLFSTDEIKEIIASAGIVGLGGAGFPTAVKLSPPKKVEYFILNAAECEPYLTTDNRLILEKTEEIIKGMKLAMKVLGVKKGYIGIEDNKKDAIKRLSHFQSLEIEIKVLKAKYPQGGERELIEAILKRRVPPKGLPYEVGVVVNNVATIFAIYEAVYLRKPLYERITTFSGDALRQAENLRVRIGTPLKELTKECKGFKETPSGVIMGGPMMGLAQQSLEVPLVKGTSGVLFLKHSRWARRKNEMKEENPCLHCGKCVEACPVDLNPSLISLATQKQKWNVAKELNVDNCIECGACEYICPAERRLMDMIKEGKKVTGFKPQAAGKKKKNFKQDQELKLLS